MFNTELKYAPWFAKDKKNGLQTHLTTNIPKWQVNTQTKTLTKAVFQPCSNLCKPTKHTNKKACDEGARLQTVHNKEGFRPTGERLPNLHNKRFANTWSKPTEWHNHFRILGGSAPLAISLACLYGSYRAKRRVEQGINKGQGGYVVGTFEPPGEPLKQVLVPLSVGRGLFSIGDLSIQPSLFPKIFKWG